MAPSKIFCDRSLIWPWFVERKYLYSNLLLSQSGIRHQTSDITYNQIPTGIMPWFRDHSNTTTTPTNTNTTMSSLVSITRTPSTSTSTSFEDNPRTDPPPDSIDTNRSRTSLITLEVYYSRGKDGFKSATPYLREPILIDFHAPNPLTFRSFLRQGIFGIRPELKYKDEDVILYQTSKGTNLLTLMDAPIDALPDLVSSSEQLLLKVIVKADRKKKYNVLVDHKLSYKDPNGYIPKWPRTRLDTQNGIPEESSVHSWKARPFTLDDWKVPKKRRRMLIIIMVVIALITGITTPVCLLLLPKMSSEKGRNPSSPTDPNAPTSSPVAPPSVFVKLKGIISAAGISNDFKDPDSIHYYALDWLAYQDAADLGSNLCSDQDDGSNASNDDLGYYYFYNRKRKLAECHANERIVRRYSLAVFHLATADLPPPEPDRRGLTRGQGSKYHWRRRVEWIDQLNFLSGTHECSWQRNDSGSDNIDDIQGVICRSEDNGDIILDESSTNSTIGEIVLNINGKLKS